MRNANLPLSLDRAERRLLAILCMNESAKDVPGFARDVLANLKAKMVGPDATVASLAQGD